MVSALEESDPIGKCVALKVALIELARKGKRLSDSHFGSSRICPNIFADLIGIYETLVQLHDIAVVVDEERCGKGKISAAIEQVAINNVVNADDSRGSNKTGEREFLPASVGFGCVDIHRNDANR